MNRRGKTCGLASVPESVKVKKEAYVRYDWLTCFFGSPERRSTQSTNSLRYARMREEFCPPQRASNGVISHPFGLRSLALAVHP